MYKYLINMNISYCTVYGHHPLCFRCRVNWYRLEYMSVISQCQCRPQLGIVRTQPGGPSTKTGHHLHVLPRNAAVGLPTVPYTVTAVCNTAGLRSEPYRNPYRIP